MGLCFIMYVQSAKDVRKEWYCMKTVTPTELRTNIYNLLDEVLETGIPLEIKKADRRLLIMPVAKVDKLQNLVTRPDVIQGNPDDLVEISWEGEVSLDLP
jgi:hypothetical protein